MAIPALIGNWEARITEDYTVISVPGRPEKQQILAVYGEKVLYRELEHRQIRSVMMRQTADVKDMQVNVEHLGSLRSAPR
jgi:hypothetical protein